MTHELFDRPDEVARTETDLLKVLRRRIAGARRVRIASGILPVEGWIGFAEGAGNVPLDILLHAPEVRPLDEVRATSPDRLLFDAIAMDRSRPAAGALSIAIENLRRQVRLGLESLSQEEGCARAARITAERLRNADIKHRLLLQGSLGIKGMLLEGTDEVVLGGTTPILDVSERGSCFPVLESKEVAAGFSKWFSELWETSHSADTALLAELEACWATARPSPFEVYVQMLHHFLASSDVELDRLVWGHPIFESLTEFQRDAVKQAVRMIGRHSGCFVADVVGLGKSYIGSGIIKYLERAEGLRSVIVCPATLVDMWEAYSEAWELNARVISLGDLTENSRLAPAFRLETNEFRGRELVLIDESHHFRNSGTQRYDLMQAFLASGRKVILLTATPLNRSCWDVYHQIKLFHQHDRTKLPVTPPALHDYFERVEEGTAQLQDLLSHLLVRRTRRDILRGYGRDWLTGERIDPARVDEYASGRVRGYFELRGRRESFPQRLLKTVSYVIEGEHAGLSDRIRAKIAPPGAAPRLGLVYARYRRDRYVLPEFTDAHGALRGQAKGLAGLMRVLLFKRLESSVEAFRNSVGRMLEANEILIQRIRDHRGIGESLRGVWPGDGEDEGERLEDLERRVPLSHMDLTSFQQDLESDCGHLRELLQMVHRIMPDRDAKVRALRRLLEGSELVNAKVLIFTQFLDTADMLGEQLSAWFPHDEIAVCAGENARRAEFTVRFAPASNPELRRKFTGPEIRILVATDLLSEGVNLQDCNVVISYDLHWNPVRLIQRFGRVDRIGSPHEQIHAFNFLPELGIERNLGLRERLANRIREIHEVIGEDTAILDPGEEINVRSVYAIYSEELMSDEELSGLTESEAVSDGVALLAKLADKSPALVAAIAQRPLALRAARAVDDGVEGVVVLLIAGDERRFVWCPRGQHPRAIQPHPALSMVRCDPEEPGMEIPEWVGEYVDLAREGFWKELLEREGDRRLRSRLRVGQHDVVDRLRGIEEQAPSGEARDRVLAFIDRFSDDLGDALVAALRGLAQRNLTDEAFLAELGRLVIAYNLHRRQAAIEGDGLPPQVRVVASMIFVAPPESDDSAPDGGGDLA